MVLLKSASDSSLSVPAAMGKRARDSKSAADKDVSLRLCALGVPRNKVPDVINAVKEAREASTHVTQYAARSGPDEFFDDVKVTHEIEMASGESWEFEWADPALLLQKMLEENDSFRKAFVSALDAHPPSQSWDIITSSDECWSGNILAISGRKFMVLSYAFDKFGKRLLTKSAAWLTFAVARTTMYKSCPGGWSEVARIILEHMFLSATNGFHTSGAVLSFRGRHLCLRASLNSVITDGDGFKLLYEWKGGAGIRSCLCCANIVSKQHLAAACRALRHISCSKVTDFEILVPH